MKIVVIGTRGIPNVMGGVESHCEELFPRIAKLGHDVTVIRRNSYVKDGLLEWNGVRLIGEKAPRLQSFEAIVHTFRAVRRAKKLRPDILHVHSIGPALLIPYAKLLGMRVVFTHHGPDYKREKWHYMARVMLRLGERLGCKFADDVIVISEEIRQLLKHKYGRTHRVYLIYNGAQSPEKCKFPEYFSELGIQEGKYILGMSRFVPEKNLHHLIMACNKINMREYRLVIAGDADFETDYTKQLREIARKKGVILTGFIRGQRLQSLLTNCACYCLPSSYEGLPIALLEAMSYGVRVIVSDIPANKEVDLNDDCYFPVGNIDALASKIEQVINDDTPGDNVVEYDMKKYDWDYIAQQVMAVYENNK